MGVHRYVLRTHTRVDAVHYDGSPESALAIQAKFPRAVARSIRNPEALIIDGLFGFEEVCPGCWITRDHMTGVMQSWPQSTFDLIHQTVSCTSDD